MFAANDLTALRLHIPDLSCLQINQLLPHEHAIKGMENYHKQMLNLFHIDHYFTIKCNLCWIWLKQYRIHSVLLLMELILHKIWTFCKIEKQLSLIDIWYGGTEDERQEAIKSVWYLLHVVWRQIKGKFEPISGKVRLFA